MNAARRALDRVLDRQSLKPMRQAFDYESAIVMQRIRRATRARRREARPIDVILITRTARKQTRAMHDKLASALEQATDITVREALRQQATLVKRLTGEGSRLDSENVIMMIESRVRAALDDKRRTAIHVIGEQLSLDIQKYTREAMNLGSVADVIDDVHEKIEHHWKRVERVVRTETTHAFAMAQSMAIDELMAEQPKVMKRWTEKINDATGAPMDDRVAEDSIVLHGQLAPPGGTFTLLNSRKLRGKFRNLVGRTWSAPPNRPYDRAVLTPWLPKLGLPAYRVVNGRRRKVR